MIRIYDRPSTVVLLSLIMTALTLGGCINIDTHLQPVNPSVKPLLSGDACAVIFFGLGAGTNTIEDARANGMRPAVDMKAPKVAPVQIRQIHSVTLQERVYLFIGLRCLEVTGEP